MGKRENFLILEQNTKNTKTNKTKHKFAYIKIENNENLSWIKIIIKCETQVVEILINFDSIKFNLISDVWTRPIIDLLLLLFLLLIFNTNHVIFLMVT